jgi:hypothetical protein
MGCSGRLAGNAGYWQCAEGHHRYQWSLRTAAPFYGPLPPQLPALAVFNHSGVMFPSRNGFQL